MAEAIRLLRGAERPLIIASTPAAYGEWTAQLQEFIETTKLPLMTEEAARGIVSDTAKVIQVEPSGVQVGRNRGVDVGIVGDVGPVVAQLCAKAAEHEWKDLPWLQRLRDALARRGQTRTAQHPRAEPDQHAGPGHRGEQKKGRRVLTLVDCAPARVT